MTPTERQARQRIREAIADRDATLDELAERTQLSRRTVSRTLLSMEETGDIEVSARKVTCTGRVRSYEFRLWRHQ